MPTPAQTAAAARCLADLERADHREKGAIVEAAAQAAGVSAKTLYRWLEPLRADKRRKRADAAERALARPVGDEPGDAALALGEDEAKTIATAMHESARGKGGAKQIMSLKRAVDALRAQGIVRAARLDTDTGELVPLSDSAISRGLRAYGLHPEQLRVPRPHRTKRTLHPNHEWQLDASVCVVYYLPGGGAAVQELDPAVHYKNKPHNLDAIREQRVIRWVCTDHTTGVVRWRYYPGAERGADVVAFLAWLMAPKGVASDPFNGVPFQLVVDPGATASGTVRRFCALLGIELIVTRPKNPRAKGSVEQAQDLVEKVFESGLRFQKHRVTDFDSLNSLADVVQRHFNANEIHGRHGLTRFDAWLRIRPEELRLAESESALRALATEHPARPKVRGDLTVEYRGERWSVRDLEVNVGEKIDVLWSPLVGANGAGHAVAVRTDAETGREIYRPLALVERDAWGFDADAPVSGERFEAMPDTAADRARKRLAKLASDTETQVDDELARRRKDFRPLAHLDNGRGLNPFHAAETAEPRTYLPRSGHAHRVALPEVRAALLDHVSAALKLAPLVRAHGRDWTPEHYAWIERRYPDGVPEEALAELVEEIAQPVRVAEAGGLRVVR